MNTNTLYRFQQTPLKRHRAYSCNVNRLSLVWDSLSVEGLAATPSSTLQHGCETTNLDLTHLYLPPKSTHIDASARSKSFINTKDRAVAESLNIYGGSIGNASTATAITRSKESDQSSVLNCQTSLIQTSQNQCYVVVQLNLPNHCQKCQELYSNHYSVINHSDNKKR